ncbi:MAG: Jag N-terminal domain-containing protein, partial [Oscillospiraceae bacterium]|nr:Jag N-terminal domain-containing protein [Oscillospiraceae bacterium]
MTQIFTAKTVDDAKALAARTFGADEEEIQFEILEEPKKSLFGRLKGEAKIRAVYIPEEKSVMNIELESEQKQEEIVTEIENTVEIPNCEEVSSESEQKEVSTEVENTVENPNCEEVFSESEQEKVSTEVENTVEISVQESKEYKKSAPVLPDEELITGNPSEEALQKIERAKIYLQGILKAMGVQAELKINAGSESALIDIQAGKNGAVIGKHGDTLDALQYLTFMIANQGDKEYYRIILNSANYRERRKKTLEELAAKIAKNVLRTGHQTTLEPMNPYERRIIHSVIAEIEGVSSKSTGEEPYRKVIISSENPPVKNNKRKNYDRDKRKNNNRRHNKKHNDN